MKKLLWLLLLLILPFEIHLKAQTVATSSQWQWKNGNIVSRTSTSSVSGMLVASKRSNGADTLSWIQVGIQPYSTLAPTVGHGWLGTNVFKWEEVYSKGLHPDTLILGGTAPLVSLYGNRLANDGAGNLSVVFSTSKIAGTEIANSTIKPANMDATGSYLGTFYQTTQDSTLQLMYKRYIDSTIAGKAFPAYASKWHQNYFPEWDSTNNQWVMATGTGSGDLVSIDTTGLTAGGVGHVTNPILQFLGGTVSLVSDTVKVTFTGTGLKRTGDTLTSAATRYDWDGATLANLNIVGTTYLTASQVTSPIVIPSGTSDLGLYAVSPNYRIQLVNADQTIITNHAFGSSWTIDRDTLYPSNSSGSLIRNLGMLKTTGLTLNGVVATSVARGSAGAATDLVTKGILTDSLGPRLSSYVLGTAENWQKTTFSAGGGTHYQYSLTPAAGDTGIIIEHTLNASDTTYLRPSNAAGLTPTLDISANAVNIRGTLVGNPQIQLLSDMTMVQHRIDSVLSISADSLVAKKMLRLRASATNPASPYVGFTADPTTTTYSLQLPPSNVNGYLYNTAGVLSFAAGSGSGGGGGNPIKVGATVADSISIGTTATITPTLTPAAGFDALTFSVTGGLQPSMFVTLDSIASRKVVKDSILAMTPWFNSLRTGTFAGSDSTWLKDSLGTKRLQIGFTHLGKDTARIVTVGATGLVVGGSGNQQLEGDTIILPGISASNPRRVIFGRTLNGGQTTSSNFLDSLRVDSMVTGKGHYSTTYTPKAWRQNCDKVSWYYPSAGADTNTADTSIKITTSPYTRAEGSDSLFLVKCSTFVGNDTTFGPMLLFPFTDSVFIDTLYLWLNTSNATNTNVELDSVHFNYTPFDAPETPTTITANNAAVVGWGVDRYGTTQTRYAIAVSTATLRLGPGDQLRCRLKINLTQNNSTLKIAQAQLRGTK